MTPIISDPASRFHATLEADCEDWLPMKSIRLITLAPGHFHAALVQKTMSSGVNRRGHIYGPLDRDTIAHVERIAAFNARPDDPTGWDIDLRAGPDWRDRFLREQPGNTVVLSGRNKPKIDLMALAVENGLHVLADKPWIVEHQDFAKLEAVLREADLREVLTWDMMTERHEITNVLQQELVRDGDLFGRWLAGNPEQPALVLESVHYLKKWVSGRPLARPWWWFDPAISGEAMADVGTHLADLALWFIAPDYPVDYMTDIALLDADRWPLVLSEEQFRFITMLAGFPEELASRVVEGQLYYAGNNSATFALRGVHVKLTATWEYEAPAGGGDTHNAIARGTTATVTIRQPHAQRSELFVAATDPIDHAEIVRIVQLKCEELASRFPNLSVEDRGNEARLIIPDELRTGHESHFASVMDDYVRFFNTPRAVPSWERANALAKYFITTKAVDLARLKRPGL
jgi:predicted dehydrogenase